MSWRSISLLCLAVCLWAASWCSAQTFLGGSGTLFWSNASNWNGGVPVSDPSTQLFFAGTDSYNATNDLPGVFTLNRLTLDARSSLGTTLSGNPLRLTANGGTAPMIVQLGSPRIHFAAPMQFDSDVTFSGTGSFQNGGLDRTDFDAPISGSGKFIFGPSPGTPLIYLNVANTHTGGMLIQDGNVRGVSGCVGTGSLRVDDDAAPPLGATAARSDGSIRLAVCHFSLPV
jgi:hypothetical protein